jgi:glutamate-1-semialdehyde 2,1-aminomutase
MDDQAYDEAFPASQVLAQQARQVLAGGVTHDLRALSPFPVFVERAAGPWKWSVDGRRLVDLWMGHGALLLGHGDPAVVDAVTLQVARSTHPGASHEAEVRWAESVCRLVPSAERVRFTSSGTEAVALAVRVARAYTGRGGLVLFDGHFHGWGDETLAPFVDGKAAGLRPEATDATTVVTPLDPGPVVDRLAGDAGRDVAAVLLEPGGGSSGALPCDVALLRAVREATRRAGALLIFDETVTGFRTAPGGVQQATGIVPDLTVLGKVLCGGLPGGAVAGRAQVMAVFDESGAPGETRRRVPHSGTFNANPVAAAAGIATLEQAADGTPGNRAAVAADALATAVGKAAARTGVDVGAFTDGASVLHLMVGAQGMGMSVEPSAAAFDLYHRHRELYLDLRRTLLTEGVDMHPLHGWVSAAHDPDAVAAAAGGFERSFARLAGRLPRR